MLVQLVPPTQPRSFEIKGAFDLERCVAALYYAYGSQVILEGGWRPDGGVDILTLQGGKTTVVQCKHWEKASGVREIRELLGAKVDFRASDAAFVSSKGFTEDARRFARRNSIELIDESSLQRALSFWALTEDFREAFDYFARKCPKCSGKLVHRTKGTTKEPFWGCSNYSSHDCRYTEPYDRRVLEPRPNFKAG